MAASTGEGRVHACLRENRDKLSKACRAEEIKLSIMQSSNTELMPNLARACKAEREAHCKGVRAGKSRVYNCLVSNSDAVRPAAAAGQPWGLGFRVYGRAPRACILCRLLLIMSARL